MEARLLQTVIAIETDIVLVRKRTRRLAELLGFDRQEQTRITTAVSEIARNAFEYARGGEVDFRIATISGQQHFLIHVRDKGPGIAELEAVLSGARKSRTGMGVGLIGARRLMDDFQIDSAPGAGTMVRLAKRLPRGKAPLAAAAIHRMMDALAADGPADPMDEIRQQNQQILLQMEELRTRQEDLEKLNQELQDTNRGVVALYAELDERADHLRRADELKSRFLSHMSHEFRTPVNSILALSRLLLSRNDGELTAEQDKQVRFIRKAAEDLIELVNDLLDLAKVEAGKTVVSPTTFTVDGLFGALRGMLRPLLVGDTVALTFEENLSLPSLDTDEGKVSQILRNFISNAIKFTERGEVRVWASLTPPNGLGMARTDGETITFYVRDTGIGIAPADIELIFQEFGQVSNRLQGRVKGTGLGLPLSRKLAELLGGQIFVESTPGQGSTFSVTLPRAYATVGAAADDPPPRWELEADKLPVLLVEDNPADAFIVQRILAGSVYQPLHARSVQEGLQALAQTRPVAILLDVVLAASESWPLLLKARQDEQLADIPIIVTSSTGDDRKALHLGADEFLAKPLESQLLVGMLDRVTGRHSVIRVFMLDDEEVARYLIRQLLPRSRYNLRSAAAGQQALELLAQEAPDIILLDLNMPGMSGWAFLDRLRSVPDLASIPVIIITSAALSAEDRLSLSGVAGIIAKSQLSGSVLETAIRSALDAPLALTVA